jgi:hypothetical protein
MLPVTNIFYIHLYKRSYILFFHIIDLYKGNKVTYIIIIYLYIYI